MFFPVRSNAGKFVSACGIIDVDVRVCKPRGHVTPYLVMTVSNSRADLHCIEDGEALFVPFKAKRSSANHSHSSSSLRSECSAIVARVQAVLASVLTAQCVVMICERVGSNSIGKSSSNGWKGVSAAEEHRQAMRDIWLLNHPLALEIDHRADPFLGNSNVPLSVQQELTDSKQRVAVEDCSDEDASSTQLQSLNTADSIVGAVSSCGIRQGKPVSTSTGLGLPLCRSFALAGGGWTGIVDSIALEREQNRAQSTRRSLPFMRRFSSAVAAISHSYRAPSDVGFTQFWAVMSVDLISSDSVASASQCSNDGRSKAQHSKPQFGSESHLSTGTPRTGSSGANEHRDSSDDVTVTSLADDYSVMRCDYEIAM